MTARKSATIALMGNPNAGKSSIFNALTGLHQHVGNWPGKTVERRAGQCQRGDWDLTIVDLPGTYSLAAESPEEMIAREFLRSEEVDLVLNVVDATNLERNLYLTVQILEMGVPLIVALNMFDQLEMHGESIDTAKLSQGLGGAPVIATAANRGRGLVQLISTAIAMLENKHDPESAAREVDMLGVLA
jgi:ferrous iron transport protein B